MANKEAIANKKNPVPLSDLLGSGQELIVQGKAYQVKPLKIKDNEEFNKINFGSQYFTLNDPDQVAKINLFMSRYLLDAAGQPMTVERCGEDDWDIADLKNFLKKVIEISG